jgi:hypothetical protein
LAKIIPQHFVCPVAKMAASFEAVMPFVGHRPFAVPLAGPFANCVRIHVEHFVGFDAVWTISCAMPKTLSIHYSLVNFFLVFQTK